MRSDWVRAEAAEGLARHVLIPVKIDDVTPPLQFRGLQTVSLLGWDGRAITREVERMLRAGAGFHPAVTAEERDARERASPPVEPRITDRDGRAAVKAPATATAVVEPTPTLPFTQHLEGGVRLELLWIPPGSFRMGDAAAGRVEVSLSRGFGIGKYPVTQEQYKALTGGNPSQLEESGLAAPVESVS